MVTNEVDNSLKIEEQLSDNWDKFNRWLLEGGHKLSLAIPSEVAQVLIPKKIMELATDPKRLKVVVYQSSPTQFGYAICEETDNELSERERIKKYVREEKGGKATVTQNDVPEGVDYMQASNYDLITYGMIGLKDKIFTRHSITGYPGYPESAMGIIFEDREEERGKGLGTSFFDRRDRVLKELGFKFVVSHITSDHPEFFRKRGEIPYSEAPLDLVQRIPPINRGPYASKAVVKVL